MSVYRIHLLRKVQEANEYGRGAEVFEIGKAVVDGIEVRASGDDNTAEDLQKRLIAAAGKISGRQDHDSWNGFREVYGETLFYLIACERKAPLKAIPTRAAPTPDFEAAGQPIARFEVKTLNVKGGVYAQDASQLAGLEANMKPLRKLARRASASAIACSRHTDPGRHYSTRFMTPSTKYPTM